MDTLDMQNALGAILGKLEALEQRNARLEREVATLRAARAEASPRPVNANTRTAASGSNGQASRGGVTSRRTWLKRAAGAAVASVAAGAMVQRDTDTAAAHHGATNNIDAGSVVAHYVYAKGSGVHGESSVQGSSATYGNNTNTTGGYGVVGDATGSGGVGVLGRSPSHFGVQGKGREGVRGESTVPYGSGVVGYAVGSGAYGVMAVSSNGVGVQGNGHTAGVQGSGTTGVNGYSSITAGTGVQGTGKVGVRGKSSVAGGAAIVGEHSGSGTTSGYGGQFKGGRAQVRLVPGTTAGKPTSGTHAKGELYMDSTATLYVCTSGSTASVPAGTWRRLTTTTA